MKAIACTRYGSPEVLQLREMEKPTPGKNEVLIKLRATAVTASDCIVRGFRIPHWHPMGIMMGLMLGFIRPRNPILGMIISGDIVSTGKDTSRFKTGDPVFGWTLSSGPIIRFGTYAEYICMSENSVITTKPVNIDYKEAAAIPYGALIALHFLKKGNIRSGMNVMIYGASGAIGTAAVQLAKYFGTRVTGVCSTKNLSLVKSLGADTVLDYTKEFVPEDIESYDLMLDAVGTWKKSDFKLKCKNALSHAGRYISVDDGSPKALLKDLILIRELAEAGHIKAVIDRSYSLDQMVEAHQYVDKGHKKGNIIINIREENV